MKTTNIKLPLAYGSHRQVLDADSNLAVQVCSGGVGIEAADELQDLIVRAVNSHDQLVAALDALISSLDDHLLLNNHSGMEVSKQYTPIVDQVIESARAVLIAAGAA